MTNKDRVIATALAVALAGCAIAAVATALWTLRFGLFAPRASLSGLQTAVRIAIVTVAAALLIVRRNSVERVALAVSAVAAASSALCGLGIDRPVVLATRLLSHLAAYTIWAVVAGRMLSARRRREPDGVAGQAEA